MSKQILIFSFLILLVFTAEGQEQEFTSQTEVKGRHSLVAYISGGRGYYTSNNGAPSYLQPEVKNFNNLATLRLMWHPDHLLNVGLETGYLTFYSYTFMDSVRTSGKIRLSAVPLLVEWTMAVTKRLNVFAGSGLYFLTTDLDYRGNTKGKKVSIGWMAAGSYIHPLSENLGLGAELKWMDAAETADGVLAAQLQLVWRFKKW